MAGRRKRRASNSTVATVDDSHIRWAKESSVLKPAPQNITDNDWPVYVLTDATIYRKDGITLANPLLVHLQGPIVVRGFLEVEEDELLHNLVKPSVKSAYIEISQSQRYSFGDGPVTLWVSGAAGWFEIRPSLKYQPMFSQVREAITLYYGVFDVYETYIRACGGKKKSKRPSPPTLDQIFLKYAVKAGDGIVRDEVEALCHKWAEFLLAHFPKEVDLKWDDVLFAKWLRDSHPDLQKRITDVANGLVPPAPPPEPQNLDEEELPRKRRVRSTKTSSRSSVVEDVEMRDFALDKSRSPQPKPVNKGKARMSETPVPLPERFRQISQPTSSKASSVPADTLRDTPMSDANSESPVDRLLAALQEVAGELLDIKKALPTKVLNGLYFKCRMRHYSASKDIVSYYAKDLLPRVGPEWNGTPWYEWLKETATQPWQPSELTKAEDIPAQTLRRNKMGPKTVSTNSQPANKLPPSIGLKTKTKRPAQIVSEDDSDEDVVGTRMRSRKSGKGASLRLVSSSKKRPASELDDQASGNRRGRKSAKTIHSDDEQMDVEDTGDDEVDGDEDAAAGYRLPLPEGTVRIVVHAERLPTTSPAGPNGTWTCDQEGCSYVVRSADEHDAQEMIQEHFRDHQTEAEKINLAVKESRGHLPINHLLDKIQALGKAALFKKRKTLNGEPLPAPVKRRLPI